MRIHVQRLSLANIGGKDLDEQLKDALEGIAQIFYNTREHYGRNGKLKANLTINVELVHDLDKGTTDLTTGLASKTPKYRRTSQALRLEGGHFYVELDDSDLQMSLPNPNRPAKQDN